MRTYRSKGFRLALLALLVVALAAGMLPVSTPPQAAAMGGQALGMVCTYGMGAAGSPVFTLTATDGIVQTGDANRIYMWGYAGPNGFQHPSPFLCVNQGDAVTVILKNNLPNDDVSITFPGQTSVLANGQPVQPQFDGSGALISLAQTAARGGGSVTYSFVAAAPGSFLYKSGAEPLKQVQMGLFGGLIVRPSMGADYAYNDVRTKFNPMTEFTVMLSEIDPIMHQAVQLGQAFDYGNYHPRYWMLNGRGMMDTMADNFVAWMPTQPYGSIARIWPYDPMMNPDPALTHYFNVMTEDNPFHPHGANGVVVGRDGHEMIGPGGEDLSYELAQIPIAPGQTWDVTFRWYDAEHYDPVLNPISVPVPPPQSLTYGELWSGSPYLGMKGVIPPDTINYNMCGEYYLIAHNHALHQLTAWGIQAMLGQGTFTRIDPPMPNNCMP
jgi:hypothetical protein